MWGNATGSHCRRATDDIDAGTGGTTATTADNYTSRSTELRTFESIEQQIDNLVQERYLMSNRTFRPLFPWVFVRVLPKEQKIGSIFTPGAQNKVVHEGIVIATWEPKDVDTVSELIPGDLVAFHHFAGMPIDGFPYDKITGSGYRCVKECNWAIDKEGGIFAKIDYNPPAKSLARIIDEDIPAGSDYWELARALEEKFILIPRDCGSITLSGR